MNPVTRRMRRLVVTTGTLITAALAFGLLNGGAMAQNGDGDYPMPPDYPPPPDYPLPPDYPPPPPPKSAKPTVLCFEGERQVFIIRFQETGGGDFKSRVQSRPGRCPGNAIINPPTD